jgi:hypothetical protein
VDDGFVDHGPQPWPLIAGQDFLPGQADFKQAFDLIRVQLYRPIPERLAGVVRGLQQPGTTTGSKLRIEAAPASRPM